MFFDYVYAPLLQLIRKLSYPVLFLEGANVGISEEEVAKVNHVHSSFMPPAIPLVLAIFGLVGQGPDINCDGSLMHGKQSCIQDLDVYGVIKKVLVCAVGSLFC